MLISSPKTSAGFILVWAFLCVVFIFCGELILDIFHAFVESVSDSGFKFFLLMNHDVNTIMFVVDRHQKFASSYMACVSSKRLCQFNYDNLELINVSIQDKY